MQGKVRRFPVLDFRQAEHALTR